VTLEELRRHLDGLDQRLLEIVAERQTTAREIARVKGQVGRATRDYGREREVILGARARAEALGVAPAVAEALMRLLIRSSLTTQERARVASQGAGSGRRALVIGGAGKIGGWFAHFLTSQGFDVQIADPAAEGAIDVPAGSAAGNAPLKDWRSSDLGQDFIVVATPLGITNRILQELALRRPGGVVFDVGSLKTPLRAGLEALRVAGVRVASIHPMFGPDTELLSGRHIIHLELGAPQVREQVEALFAATMVEQVVMSLDEHDRLIAYVLGLSHALNIAFFTALAESGESAPRLVKLSSTTFDAQFDIASRVAEESPELYFEIQRLNEFGGESLDALARAVEALRSAVQAGDLQRFRTLMLQGLEYTQGRRVVTQQRA
jgi:chorismate mutase/prephenate dehydrogenase